MTAFSPARLTATALCLASLTLRSAPAKPPEIATAINQLGLDLYREQIKTAGGAGVLISPYSISTARAMAYTGADGVTRDEMQRVLHFPGDQAAVGAAFHTLAGQLNDVVTESEKLVARMKEHGGDATPIQLSIANRLFAQEGYTLRPAFVENLRTQFDSSLDELDFAHASERARMVINEWVATQTHDRIKDLLPVGQPPASTRLAVVNALYLSAKWQNPFYAESTQPEPFHIAIAAPTSVPTMHAQEYLGYAKSDDYTVVTLPYLNRGLQFVLLVPDKVDGVSELERKLTAKKLGSFARLHSRIVELHLPKFKLEPETMPLRETLMKLGLKTAFDVPRRSANFDRMAERKPDDYLYISAVFHKTWLSLDEQGTEATAATAVVMLQTLGVEVGRPEPPPEVRADRPFLFAIQHVESGACLFLGRVTDPR